MLANDREITARRARNGARLHPLCTHTYTMEVTIKTITSQLFRQAFQPGARADFNRLQFPDPLCNSLTPLCSLQTEVFACANSALPLRHCREPHIRLLRLHKTSGSLCTAVIAAHTILVRAHTLVVTQTFGYMICPVITPLHF